MRAILILVIGTAAAALAYAISRASEGFVEAGSVMMAVFLIPVTIGIAAALVINHDARLDPTGKISRAFTSVLQPIGAAPPGGRCNVCRHRMVPFESIWVCSSCDRIPADATAASSGWSD